ncbi:MAG: class I SAM-dependent methyltransferase [Deltaproteobacteria bacterium]|nr:class I SAM-dependent methyltransferase [Deltaproteobacteria bacterium]
MTVRSHERVPLRLVRPDESETVEVRTALERLAGGLPRDFAIRLWTGETIAPDPARRPVFTLVLRRPSSLRRMIWPPWRRTFADAFVHGAFDVEGDIVAAMALRRRLKLRRLGLSGALALMSSGHDRDEIVTRPRPRWAREGGDSDFFSLWLDRRMVYSCGFFPSPRASLEAAQEAKLELVCRKLRLQPGERLLDLECGWGSLVIHAAERHRAMAFGLTRSPEQLAWARARIAERELGDRCRVELADFFDLDSQEPFDKLASVGMFEDKGRGLYEHFARAWSLLRPGGALLTHGVSATRERWWRRVIPGAGDPLREIVLENGEPRPFHDGAREARRAGFELRDVESLREHYSLTLRHWIARLEGGRDQIVRSSGDEVYRSWLLFLAAAAALFDEGTINVYQSLYVRPDRGKSGLPLGRVDWYRMPLVGF